jgi:ASC-1-like (ASCH) protein
MSKDHYLKTRPEYLERVWSGQKRFEVRKNDRDFQVGDRLFLQGYDPHANQMCGSDCVVKVTYILHGGQFGIEPGYCVMAIEPDNDL